MAFWDNVTYAGYELNSLGHFAIDFVDVASPPEEALTQKRISRNDGAVLYNREKGVRKITIIGHTTAQDFADMHDTRNQLLQVLDNTESTLEVPIGNEIWQFTCTLENMIVTNPMGGYAVFTITFTCSDPFGYEKSTVTIVNGQTTTSDSDTFSFAAIEGVYPPYPVIRLTLSGITDTSAKTITLSNPQADSLSVTDTFSSGDVILIDMWNRTVKVSGVNHDYTGNYFPLQVGSTDMYYADNFTNRSVNTIITYQKRY